METEETATTSLGADIATSSGATSTTSSPAKNTRSQQHAPADAHQQAPAAARQKIPLLVPKTLNPERTIIGEGVQDAGPLREKATAERAEKRQKNEETVLALTQKIITMAKNCDEESLDLLQEVLFVDRDAHFAP